MIRKQAVQTPPVLEPREVIRFGAFSFRIDRRELRRDDEIIRLTDRERDLLAILAQKPGETIPATPTPAAQGFSVGQFDAMVKKVDKNGDGSISREEAAGAKWFERLDQNADGVVEAEELAMVRKIITRGGAAVDGSGVPYNAPSLTSDDVKKVTSGPEILKPGDVSVGRLMASQNSGRHRCEFAGQSGTASRG
jgi:hypothetical protein